MSSRTGGATSRARASRGSARGAAADLVRALDLRVVVPATLLTAIGCVSIAANRPDLLGTHLMGVAAGLVAFVVAVAVPYRRLVQGAYPFYAFGLLLLLLLFVPGLGRTAKHATRWLQLGGVGLQPSEVAKVAVVLALARYVRFRRDHRTFRGLVVPFLLTFVPLALILKQPDLGTALTLVPVLFAMLWVAGARPRHLGTVVVLGVLAIPVLYVVALKPYQRERVRTFVAPVTSVVETIAASAVPTVHPFAATAPVVPRDSVAAPDDYHVNMSLAAIAGGGVLGQGHLQGELNTGSFVPEAWTDFVFTVWAEEHGFAGVLVLLAALLALIGGLLAVAREVREPCGRLVAVGAAVLLGFQASVNLAMTVGLAPITGLPLPFLSFGRTSMVACWLLLGLALNARAHRPIVVGADELA